MVTAVWIVIVILVAYTVGSVAFTFWVLRWPDVRDRRLRYMEYQGVLFTVAYLVLVGTLLAYRRFDSKHPLWLAAVGLADSAVLLATGWFSLRYFIPLQRDLAQAVRARRTAGRDSQDRP